ncbi:MAG TPA: aminotransferase class V-fold PLP-dependent enzyme [Bryobacterales bacterium]|jgi:cysteine desulfurase/selenocysteine lyase|nr:aminotransferase class V-fold PLP-dependent enzyme [Bryobacterales bacterium]
MAYDWRQARNQFPVLERWTYLNTATFGPVPRCAVEAANDYLCRRNELACLDFLDWFDDADQTRAAAAALLQAAPADIAFVPNTATALSWLVQGIDWKPGDRVVALEGEFPNNSYFGYALAERGADFFEAPLPGGQFSLDRFCSAIHRNTRLVLMSAINYSTGLRPPLAEIGRFLQERGVLFYVDATQGLGAIRLDAPSLRAAMIAAHGYKWLLCPPGIGFCYISPEVREWLRPAVFSWRSHEDWRCVDALHHGPPRLSSKAEKYEGGTQNFPGIYAMRAVLEMMLQIGLSEIEQRVAHLAEKVRGVLRRTSGDMASDRLPYYDSPLIAARFPGTDVSRLAVRLRDLTVVVAARHDHLRISPHFFNNEQDVARLEEALRKTGL